MAEQTVEEWPPLAVPLSLIDDTQPATIPAAVRAIEPGVALSPSEKAGVTQLAEEFFQAVGEVETADPTAQSYRERWTQAQQLSDIQLKARHGDALWLKLHAESYRQARARAEAGVGAE